MTEFNPGASLEGLAELVVRLPDGVNFASGEVGVLAKTLLTGKAEERDPLKYAEIFRRAKAHQAATPWMRFACLAEKVNGQRRAKGADMPALAEELHQLVAEASVQLPNTKEKNVLLGGVLWNVALVRRGLRRYSEAAEAQRQSSSWYGLAGDVEKQLIGLFAAEVENVSAAFVGGDNNTISFSLQALIAARDYVKNATPVYPGWMKDNAPLHVEWATMMGRLMFHGPFHWNVQVGAPSSDFKRGLHSPFAQWAKVFSVCDMYSEEWYEDVVKQVPVDLPSSSADNAALTVQIVVALAERKLDKIDEAKARLMAVANHQGPDGGIPMAVAERILRSYF